MKMNATVQETGPDWSVTKPSDASKRRAVTTLAQSVALASAVVFILKYSFNLL